MGINITRATGQLQRFEPTEDAVILLITSGVAEGDLALLETKQLFSLDDLVNLNVTEANNPTLYRDVKDFYTLTGPGAELNIMVLSDTTTLEDICNPTKNNAKKMLDDVDGRGVVLMVNIKRPVGYTATITDGLDADVWAGVSKMDLLAKQFQTDNVPFAGILPALGFAKANVANIPLRNTRTTENVLVFAGCEKADNHISMGVLAAWIAQHQVHQNVGRVASGKVVDTAFYPDGTKADEMRYQWKQLNDKGIVQLVKVRGKAGYFFYDDPMMTAKSGDYSSLSWIRTIIKVQRITATKLTDLLNEDVDINPVTGKPDSTLLSDWESMVEKEIRSQMIDVPLIKKKEISGISVQIDPDSDILNDQIDATINVVRQGQVKTFNVKIGYVQTLSES